MTDIVKRLRDMRAYGGRDYACMDDAANEIERLRQDLSREVIGECEDCGHKIIAPLKRREDVEGGGWRKVTTEMQAKPDTGYVLSRSTKYIIVFDGNQPWEYTLPPLPNGSDTSEERT